MKIFQSVNTFKLLINKLSTFQWTDMYVNKNPFSSKVNYIFVKLSYIIEDPAIWNIFVHFYIFLVQIVKRNKK
jgi:hypothetical protein